MIDLFSNFSLTQIVFFITFFACAIKGISDFFDWIKEKYQEKFDEDYKATQGTEDFKLMQLHYDELDNKINSLSVSIQQSFAVINTAIMHDIKQWIIDKHKYYIDKGWISISELDMIEFRYMDYKALGGNSTIPPLKEELRALPKHEI